MTAAKKTWVRVQLLLIAAVFFGPLAIAALLYFSGGLQPIGRTNHGELLEPIVNIPEALPDSPVSARIDDYWVLVYLNDGACTEVCERALHTTRQLRLMLGNEMNRLLRLFLHGESPPDTVFLNAEHAGLIILRDSAFSELLDNKRPAILSDGGYFLLDPLGNLVMYFEPALDPADMVKDIKRLLKLSRIG